MLPTVSKGRGTSAVRPAPGFSQYLRRIVKDCNLGSSLVLVKVATNGYRVYVLANASSLYLTQSCFLIGAYRVATCEHNMGDSYQHTKYHKQTKNQWARDDPAFAVIFCLFLIVATSAYCAAYGVTWVHSVFTVISVVVFHFLLAGTILATCCWFLTNTYMREETPSSHAVEQRVEWLYAFDVHCNSFFPAFVLLYVIQYFVSPLLVAHGFFPMLVSNLLFMVAISYYHYLNFLGYDVLPFLDKTTFFLYPIGLVIILSPLMILSGFNPTRYMMRLYFG